MSRFENRVSIRRATIASRIFRWIVRSDDRNDFATCWVIVDPPCATTPARRLALSARTMPR